MQPTTITDVRTIGVTVSNQDDALAFYVATLGFEKRLDAEISPTMRWIEVAPAGATTSIALVVDDGATNAAGMASCGGAGTTALNDDDASAAESVANATGAAPGPKGRNALRATAMWIRSAC